MPKIEIYTWSYCPYCVRAKALLDQKALAYTEYVIDGDEEAREAMSRRTGGRRSLPQIFIDGRHVGGCSELYALEHAGTLDAMLAS